MRSICMSLHIPSTVVVRTYAYSSCVLNCVIWLVFLFWQLNILTLQCLVSDWYPAKKALVSHVTIYGEMIFCMYIWFSKVLRKNLYFDVMWSHEEGKIFVIFSFPSLVSSSPAYKNTRRHQSSSKSSGKPHQGITMVIPW